MQNRLTDTENKLVLQKGRGKGEGQISGYGINRDKPPYIKGISNEDTLYRTGNYIQYPAVTYNGVYTPKILNHNVMYLKLTQHCKSIILQFFKKRASKKTTSPALSRA